MRPVQRQGVGGRRSASESLGPIRRRCRDPWSCYAEDMLSIRACFLFAIIGLTLLACSGGTLEITARDVVGKYKGVGYSGLGLFAGDISVPDGYVRHTGKWNFGRYIEAKQCREVEFRTDGHLLGIKCASVGPNGVTGFDCGTDQECTMRRYVESSDQLRV